MFRLLKKKKGKKKKKKRRGGLSDIPGEDSSSTSGDDDFQTMNEPQAVAHHMPDNVREYGGRGDSSDSDSDGFVGGNADDFQRGGGIPDGSDSSDSDGFAGGDADEESDSDDDFAGGQPSSSHGSRGGGGRGGGRRRGRKHKIFLLYDVKTWPELELPHSSAGSASARDFAGNRSSAYLTGFNSRTSLSFPDIRVDNDAVNEIKRKFSYCSSYQYQTNWGTSLRNGLNFVKTWSRLRSYNVDGYKLYDLVLPIFREIGTNIDNSIRDKFNLIENRTVRTVVLEYYGRILSYQFSRMQQNQNVVNLLIAILNQRGTEIGEHANKFATDILTSVNQLLLSAILSGQWVPHFRDMMNKLKEHLRQAELVDVYRKSRFNPSKFYRDMGNKLKVELKNLFAAGASDEELNRRFRDIQERFWTSVAKTLRELALHGVDDKMKDETVKELDEHMRKSKTLLIGQYLKKLMYDKKLFAIVKTGELVDELRKKVDGVEIDDWKEFVGERKKELEGGLESIEKTVGQGYTGLSPSTVVQRLGVVFDEYVKKTNKEMGKIVMKIARRCKEREAERNKHTASEIAVDDIGLEIDGMEVEDEGEELDMPSDIDDDEVEVAVGQNKNNDDDDIEVDPSTLPKIKMKKIDPIKLSFDLHVINFKKFRTCMLKYLNSMLKKVFVNFDEKLGERLMEMRKSFFGMLNNVIPPLARILQFDIVRVGVMLDFLNNINSWKQVMEPDYDWKRFRGDYGSLLRRVLAKFCPPPGPKRDDISEEDVDKEVNKGVAMFWAKVRKEIGPIGIEVQKKHEKEKNMLILKAIIEQHEDIDFVDWDQELQNREEELDQILENYFNNTEEESSETPLMGEMLQFFARVQLECQFFKKINDKKRELEVNAHLKKLLTKGFHSVSEEGSGLNALEIKLFYEVEKMLGSGAFGKVLQVKRKIDGKMFAMKLAQFERKIDMRRKQVFEIVLLKKLRHPYIIGFEDVFFDEDFHYLVMEMGSTALDGFIEKVNGRQKPLEEIVLWKFLIQMCIGFNVIHQRGIVHQDVKPANILLGGSDYDIKICDLGMSKELEEENRSAEGGTVVYMSPEHVGHFQDRSIQISEKIDCWAVGLIMYELCRAGRGPPAKFTRRYPHPVIYEYFETNTLENPITGYSSTLFMIIQKLLMRKPEDRWNTMDVLKNQRVKSMAKKLRILYKDTEINYNPDKCFSANFHNRHGNRVLSLLRECFTQDELKAKFMYETNPRARTSSGRVRSSPQQQRNKNKKKKKSKGTIYFIESPPKERDSSICLFKRLIIVDVLKLLHLTQFCHEIHMEGVVEYNIPEIFKGIENDLGKSPLFRYSMLKSLFLKMVINPVEFYSFVFGNNFSILGGEDKELFELEEKIFINRKAVIVKKQRGRSSQRQRGPISGGKMNSEKIQELFRKYDCSNEEELSQVIFKKRIQAAMQILLKSLKKAKEMSPREKKKRGDFEGVFYYGSSIVLKEMMELSKRVGVDLIVIQPFPVVSGPSQNDEEGEKNIDHVMSLHMDQDESRFDVKLDDMVKRELASTLQWKELFEKGKKYYQGKDLRNAVRKFGSCLALQPFYLDNRRYFQKAVKEYEKLKLQRRRQRAGKGGGRGGIEEADPGMNKKVLLRQLLKMLETQEGQAKIKVEKADKRLVKKHRRNVDLIETPGVDVDPTKIPFLEIDDEEDEGEVDERQRKRERRRKERERRRRKRKKIEAEIDMEGFGAESERIDLRSIMRN